MNKGDLVIPVSSPDQWDAPGVIIKGPYGFVEKVKSRWDGKAILTNETKVVDILLGTEILSQIPIEKLKSHIHTIRGKSIVAITETRLLKKHIVSIEKDALVKNVPSQTTHISRSHKLFFKGRMIKAEDLVDVCEHVHFIPYNRETLYNVLLEEYDKMIINNLNLILTKVDLPLYLHNYRL